jgi:hypothetical protein
MLHSEFFMSSKKNATSQTNVQTWSHCFDFFFFLQEILRQFIVYSVQVIFATRCFAIKRFYSHAQVDYDHGQSHCQSVTSQSWCNFSMCHDNCSPIGALLTPAQVHSKRWYTICTMTVILLILTYSGPGSGSTRGSGSTLSPGHDTQRPGAQSFHVQPVRESFVKIWPGPIGLHLNPRHFSHCSCGPAARGSRIHLSHFLLQGWFKQHFKRCPSISRLFRLTETET